jgi:hypothetical protein
MRKYVYSNAASGESLAEFAAYIIDILHLLYCRGDRYRVRWRG